MSNIEKRVAALEAKLAALTSKYDPAACSAAVAEGATLVNLIADQEDFNRALFDRAYDATIALDRLI